MRLEQEVALTNPGRLNVSVPWVYFALREGNADLDADTVASDLGTSLTGTLSSPAQKQWGRPIDEEVMSGIVVVAAEGPTPVGAGTLAYTASGTTLQWTPFGGSAGVAVDISTKGGYRIEGGAAGQALEVWSSGTLPGTDDSVTVTVPPIVTGWLGEGTSGSAIEVTRAGQTSAYDTLFGLSATDSFLLWMHFGGVSEGVEALCELGSRVTAQPIAGVRVEQNSIQGFRCVFGDGVTEVSPSVSAISTVGLSSTVIFLVNRQIQSAITYRSGVNNEAVPGVGQDVTAIGAPTFDSPLTSLVFGAQKVIGGSALQGGSNVSALLHRFGFVRLGDSVPSNIDDIITAITRGQGRPPRLLESI